MSKIDPTSPETQCAVLLETLRNCYSQIICKSPEFLAMHTTIWMPHEVKVHVGTPNEISIQLTYSQTQELSGRIGEQYPIFTFYQHNGFIKIYEVQLANPGGEVAKKALELMRRIQQHYARLFEARRKQLVDKFESNLIPLLLRSADERKTIAEEMDKQPDLQFAPRETFSK